MLGCKRIHTTSYHPMANGMIECFHRQLKSVLKAYPNTLDWADSLPMALLGIRTTLKQDCRCTPAELVYGTTLRIPGEFFAPSTDAAIPDPSSYVTKLKESMKHLRASPSRQQQRSSYVSDNLQTCTHAFIRHDAIKKPLQPPYEGPYEVISRSPKHFTMNVKGSKEIVSLDRLKPAFVDTPISASDCLLPSTAPSSETITSETQEASTNFKTITRSGRGVKWPKHLT